MAKKTNKRVQKAKSRVEALVHRGYRLEHDNASATYRAAFKQHANPTEKAKVKHERRKLLGLPTGVKGLFK